MRTKNSIINAITSICSQILVLLVTLVSRRLIIVYMNSSLLGYEGLFKDILTFLAFSELGIGAAITFNLYRTVAIQDQEETENLMIIYKNIYRVIGVAVSLLGIALMPTLKYICKGSDISEQYMYTIYLIQLATVVSTYFLAYKRVRFVAEQKEYKCIQVETCINITSQLVKLAVLYFAQNYILYLLVALFQNIIANIIISSKYNKEYGKIPKRRISLAEIKERNLLSEMKNVTLHKVAMYIYSGTDNVLISGFLGVGRVTYFTNYTIVSNQLNSLFDGLFKPITASIGNLVYKEDSEASKDIFWGMDVLFFFFASFIAVAVYVMQEPFITLWIGEEFILSQSFLILLVMNLYIAIVHKAFVYYRNTLGNYKMDRKFMTLSACTNLLISILLIGRFQFAGIMLGTVIGHLCIWFGRCYCIFKEYLKCSPFKYVLRQIAQVMLVLMEMFLTKKIVLLLPQNVSGLIASGVVAFVVTLLINLLVFAKTKSFGIILTYAKQVKSIILNIRK